MEQNEGLQLVSFVRDFYREEFQFYDLGQTIEEDRAKIFTDIMLGRMYARVLTNDEAGGDDYVATLIQGQTLQTLTATIDLGYSQSR